MRFLATTPRDPSRDDTIIARRHRPGICGQAFSTCEKSSSTGVERPRICTATCRRFFS
jgi:hypothetical protein